MPTSSTTIETLTSLLSHLVRFPTVPEDTATNRAALDWVQEQLKGLPLRIERLEHNGVPALLATTKHPRNPKLWLLGHIDVVPAPASAFEPVIKDGRLMGRGAFDMKYGIACFIALLQELGPQLSQYDLGLMLTADEEAGSADGAEWLAARGYRSQAIFLPECGTSWHMELGAKGIINWQLTARGQSAHGSRPWLGRNAIDRLLRVVDLARQNVPTEPCGDPAHLHCTMNLGQLTGGEAANQVPELAQAALDMRIVPGISLEEAAAWVANAAATDDSVEAKILFSSPPFRNPDGTAVELFQRLANEAYGQRVPSMIAHGTSDGRFFAPHGIPILTVPPLGGGQHGADEWVDLADLTRYYGFMKQFVQEFTHLPSTTR
ncbi:MAG TPA: M20/M25/M40 family metallo-hydrolase [Candidatus Saccharimonadia bacterium]|nr:M20/M25/M40 family metallo-hydrolase [Candidatus Saccharimonadia bacterium]